jgi:hypothetical protein
LLKFFDEDNTSPLFLKICFQFNVTEKRFVLFAISKLDNVFFGVARLFVFFVFFRVVRVKKLNIMRYTEADMGGRLRP